jgi:hypothetical protein
VEEWSVIIPVVLHLFNYSNKHISSILHPEMRPERCIRRRDVVVHDDCNTLCMMSLPSPVPTELTVIRH